MFNQYIQKYPVSTKIYEINIQKKYFRGKNSIKLLVGKNFHDLPTVYFQTSPNDDPVKFIVGNNVCNVTKISSLFADEIFTDKVTH